jgi:hypothetical protein
VAFLVDIALIVLGGLWFLLRNRGQNSGSPLPPSNLVDGHHGPTGRDPSKSLTNALEKLFAPLSAIEEQQRQQAAIFLKILEALTPLSYLSKTTEELAKASFKKESTEVEGVPQPAPPLSDKEKARLSYETFLRGESVSADSIKLSDVGGSSAEHALGGRRTTLEENPNGAIILFPNTDGHGRGWAYPNTAIFYKLEALNSLFPHFTAEQFESLKTNKSLDGCNVEPVPLKKVDETGQWQVETTGEVG